MNRLRGTNPLLFELFCFFFLILTHWNDDRLASRPSRRTHNISMTRFRRGSEKCFAHFVVIYENHSLLLLVLFARINSGPDIREIIYENSIFRQQPCIQQSRSRRHYHKSRFPSIFLVRAARPNHNMPSCTAWEMNLFFWRRQKRKWNQPRIIKVSRGGKHTMRFMSSTSRSRSNF